MKRELLAQSLAQMKDRKPADDASASPKAPLTEGGPRSLKNMSDVLTQVASQAPQEIDVSDIAASEITDRFDVENNLDDLVESIRNSGQQLPALVRYRRGAGPRYEVVYGRRRIAACRRLGIKVKAYIKEMDLREALMSQALENSARMERSFIEQAVFASLLEEAEFSRQDICQALAVDKGTLSRMLSVVRDVPDQVIRAIGAAHHSGRRPWSELRRLATLEAAPSAAEMLSLMPGDLDDPDQRLTALIAALQQREEEDKRTEQAAAARSTPSPAPATRIAGGAVSYKAQDKRITIQTENGEPAFIRFLEENLEEVYRNWIKTRTL